MNPIPPTEYPATLELAKLKVMEEVHAIEKKRRMGGTGESGPKYAFTALEDLITELRPALVKNGLLIAPVGYEVLADGKLAMANNKQMTRVVYRAKFKLSHVSGQSEILEAIGEAADNMDKASNKAMTAALKYLLTQTFLLQGADDPDAYASREQEAPAKQAKPQAAQAPAGQPAAAPTWQPTPEQRQVINYVRGMIDGEVQKKFQAGEVVDWNYFAAHAKVIAAQQQLDQLGLPRDKWLPILRPCCRKYFETYIYPCLVVEKIDLAKEMIPQVEACAHVLGPQWATELVEAIGKADKMIADELAEAGI